MVIVDECHKLSAAAWSGFLKVIEEPPENTYFAFCTTEENKIPATIKTRCVTYKLKDVSRQKLFELVIQISAKEGLTLPEEVVTIIAEKANGSPRQALTFLAQCAKCKTRAEAYQLIESVDETIEGIKLFRAISKGEKDWTILNQLINSIENPNPETLRIGIFNYFSKCVKNNSNFNPDWMKLLDCFSVPYPYPNSMGHFYLSLARYVCEE
jgi:DNA polymerase III gamma/tau subunit